MSGDDQIAILVESALDTDDLVMEIQVRDATGHRLASWLAPHDVDQLATQLKAFKTGSRPSTVMGQLSKGFSDAQLEQLADYFSRQKQ